MKVVEKSDVSAVSKMLATGGVVGVPTETVFGLAVRLDQPEAIRKLMTIKERGVESGKVFTLVPEKASDFSKFAVVSPAAQKLIDKYVPGKLTLILSRASEFSHFYFDNFETIGLRIPDFELFRELLPLTGPLLLTSANRRGGVPEVEYEKVAATLPEIDLIVAADAAGQTASTIVDLTGNSPQIVRQGDLVI